MYSEAEVVLLLLLRLRVQVIIKSALFYNCIIINIIIKNEYHILCVLSDFRGIVVNLFLSSTSMSSCNLCKSLSILSTSLPIFSISLGGSPRSIAQSK